MSRSLYLHSSGRRRGQALLLAVLVMVFAALIGITFITVVAINIGQTGREEERDKARQAAQAGLAFANLQLTNSILATKWRPVNEVQRVNATAGVPQSGDADYFAYWTPFDIVQGWNNEGFVKFPDPRSVTPSFNVPNYLMKVEKIGTDPIKDSDNINKDKTGALRITTIGLSPDDPTSFYKIVAYKAGPAQQPLTGAMRSVSNWDFQNDTVPSGKVEAYTAGTPATLTLKEVEGNLPAAPFYIVVGGATDTSTISGQVVQAATNLGGNRWQLTLPADIAPAGTAAVDTRVEVAAAIGAPRSLDLVNDGNNTDIQFDVSTATAARPGSVWVNGGLLWYGEVNTVNLNSPSNGGVPGFIRASGLMRRTDSSVPVNVAGDTSAAGTVTGTLVTDSKATNFPLGTAAGDHDEIVSDGFNRLSGNPTPSRQVKPFTPPNLNSGGAGFGRYRQLSKYSVPSDTSYPPQSGAYGYGRDGIYINNPEDREKVYDTTLTRFREMNSGELRNLWFGEQTTNAFNRLGTPAAANVADKSLEEQHLRGWVGLDEFQARGALVEINANDTITITLDARADNVTGDLTRSQGPVAEKGWRNTDGTLLGGATSGGVYSRTFDWPEQGVIFAEGNIRIRGMKTTDAPRSLTVVSMNNIYIEDSVGTGPTKKLLLLARKNVILNPTRVTGRIDYQTRLSGAASVNDTTLQVEDAASFKRGDWLYLGDSGTTAPVCVQSVSGNTVTLFAATPVTTAAAAGLPVRTQTDPLTTTNTPYTQYTNRLTQFSETLQRRVPNDGNNNLRLAMRHSAERRTTANERALTITTVQTTDPANLASLTKAELENKLVGAQQDGVILPSQKFLKIPYEDSVSTPPNSHDFPGAAPADDAAALLLRAVDGDTDDDNDIKAYLESRRTAPDWHYTVTDPEGYGALPSPPPYFFLAAVGNRYDANRTINPSLTPFPYRKNLFNGGTPASYTIPMATSVQLLVNGVQSMLQNDHWNPSLSGGSGAYEAVRQFGFNFDHGGSATTYDKWEDVLTVDQSFYRSGYGLADDAAVTGDLDNTYYTLDSRTLSDFPANTPTSDFPSNTVAFRFDTRAQNYFDAAGDARIPYYRLSRVKLEKATLDGTTHDLSALEPGHTINVNAFVYAQEGSWYVLPGIFFDENVRRDWVDLPGAAASPTQDDGETLDLNRDGTTTEAERAAVYRYYRYNYKIAFKGAILENKSATVTNAGTSGAATEIKGDVADWTNKWVSSTLTAANFPGGTLDHSTVNYGEELQSITYEFDLDAALPASTLDTDDGFNPPVTPELMYQTG